MAKRKEQEFTIVEIPGDKDLGELLAEEIVRYINDKYGFEVVRVKRNKGNNSENKNF